jgi:hydrogenase maturation protein HypF
LFDGASALILGVESSAFEGFPAMLLEAACDELETADYALPLRSSTPLELDWRPMIAAILNDRQAGISPGVIAQRFHRGLAAGIAAVCRKFSHLPVVLAGGVFQNRILTEMTAGALAAAGQVVGRPGKIPPGDGGLAAGQLAIAAARYSRGKPVRN